jgi:glucosamine 6-phosphate synthetase-like amidotransferase/phosphosugar isomerase protein
MCGIATISIGRKARGRIPYVRLRELVRELMVELQPRGIDASGIAVINDPAVDESWVFKKPLRPGRLVARPMFQKALEKIGPHTNFIMLHARAVTVGGNENNYNNHPIVIPNFVGIHNGTLYNDEKLFDKYSDAFQREGQVDSEIIFRLFSHFIEQGLSPREAIEETSAELLGAFTGAVVDWRHPHRMVMFKQERPLCLVRIPYYDMVVALSESRHFHWATQRLRIKAQASHVYVFDGTGLIMDVNKAGPLVNSVEDFDLKTPKSRVGHPRTNWLTSYVE